ncbi:MAG: DUF2459 domain-containing protein [Acidiferrobacter sp.]
MVHDRPLPWQAARALRGTVVLALLFLTSCAPAVRAAHAVSWPPATTLVVGMINQGWHSGLILPATEIRGPLAPLRAWFPHARALVLGFGNRRFYMQRHPGLAVGLRALFPSPAVLYVQGWRHRHTAHTGLIFWRCLTSAGLRHLQRFLAQDFRHTPTGAWAPPLVPLHAVGGRFFAATTPYDAFHTCNTWTVLALHHAGLPIDTTGVLFADQARAAVRATPRCPVGSPPFRRPRAGPPAPSIRPQPG